jgi:hypothetical protein
MMNEIPKDINGDEAMLVNDLIDLLTHISKSYGNLPVFMLKEWDWVTVAYLSEADGSYSKTFPHIRLE